MNKKIYSYLGLAFGWTWAFWIGSYVLSMNAGIKLATDLSIFQVFSLVGQPSFVYQLGFALGVFGPLLGYIFSGQRRQWFGKPAKEFTWLVLLMPFGMMLPGLLLSLGFGYLDPKILTGEALVAVIGYLVANFITSGTEEFGWRGVLYPQLKATTAKFWDVSLKGGIIWAIWHYPLMVMLYLPFGLAVLIPSLIGFTASIVGMNYITNVIYEKTNSIWLSMLLHALNNTTSFLMILLFPLSPFMFVSSIMVWVVVALLERRYKID